MRILIGGIALSLLISCGKRQTTETKDAASEMRLVTSESLLLATIDPTAYPWRAAISELDLVTREVRPVLTGESGDAALFRVGGEALLFNRSADSKNFRRLTKTGEHSFDTGEQKSFGGGEIGDPHDALDLGEGKTLLAQYTQGALTVIDQATGDRLGTVEAEWDLPAGTSLRPEALVRRQIDGKTKIYVIHQAFGTEGGLLYANGSQQVFVLEQNGTALTVRDLNPDAPKVQGIKLSGSFPVPTRHQLGDRIMLVSMCSRYVVAGSSMAGKTCDAAVEEIDPATDIARVVWSLTDSPYFMNGPVYPGPTASSFFANVEIKTDDRTYEQVVGRFDVDTRTVEKVYSFTTGSGGFWASFFDEASQILYVGDSHPQNGGMLTVIPMGGQGDRATIGLSGAPYSGVFVPR